MGSPKILDGNVISDSDPLQVVVISGGGGGGGGAATIADGADVNAGAIADAAATAGGTGTLSAKLRTLSASIGAVADAAWASGNGTVIAILKAIAGKIPAVGQATAAASMPVVLASDQGAVPITSPTKGVRVTPTVTAGAYTANDVVGGVLTFANAARASTGGGIIESVIVTDRGNVGAALTLVFFSATPSSALNDNDAFTWGTNDADLALFLGSVDVATGDYKTLPTGKKVATKPSVGIEYDCAATSLFAYAIGTGGPTYVATTDLGIRVGLIPA